MRQGGAEKAFELCKSQEFWKSQESFWTLLLEDLWER